MTLWSIPRRKWMFAVAALGLCGAVALGLVWWKASGALRRAAGQSDDSVLSFSVRALAAPVDNGFEAVSAPAAFASAAELNGHLYIAGPAGLNEYDEAAHFVRTFAVGRELPAAPLVRMAKGILADSRQPELLIATTGAGVLAFNGTGFRQIAADDRDARTITALLPTASGHLLLGTAKRGLLLYDGHQLRVFHPTLKQIYVTELAGDENDLWVGTLDRGAAHWHGGVTDWFSDANSLPDARVFALAVRGPKAWVGGPDGIAEFDAGRLVRTFAGGLFVRALQAEDKTLLAATMDEGLLQLPLVASAHATREHQSAGEVAEAAQLFPVGDTLYALSARTLYRRGASGAWTPLISAGDGVLSDRNISALEPDASGHLWIGYFDRGLDIYTDAAQQVRHLEDEHLFCVNRIRATALQGSTLVATANGLVLFDAAGNRRQVLGRKDGLIADHVTDVAAYQDGLVIATPAGLTISDANGMRSLYAFHGLVNNHVYTVAASGNTLMAGTLGGLSRLEGDQVKLSYTTATSALKHNWITALVPAGNEWWIGTYGAGVERMDAAGRVSQAGRKGDDAVINPNAMLATGNLLLAGTLGRGLYVYERNSERWWALTDGLPSLNVTALAAANGFIYVGTDNGLVRIPQQRLER